MRYCNYTHLDQSDCSNFFMYIIKHVYIMTKDLTSEKKKKGPFR